MPHQAIDQTGTPHVHRARTAVCTTQLQNKSHSDCMFESKSTSGFISNMGNENKQTLTFQIKYLSAKPTMSPKTL